jgi:tetratricopeptide (TPR) repeat protein
MGKYEEAISWFDKSLDFDSQLLQHPEARLIQVQSLNNKALALKQLGNNDEALSCCNYALKTIPDFPDTLNNKGTILNDLGMHHDALECFNEALRIQPNHASSLHNRKLTLDFLKQN